ncbi:MAG: hypothetical protein IJ512_02075 [Ruminococcus sp.]|nr:hypothetical protein [Ruminococcus sp.]
MADLMKCAKADYKILAERYDQFRVPAARVTIDGRQFSTVTAKLSSGSGALLIQSLEADLYHEEASCVRIVLTDVYDREGSSFQDAASLGSSCKAEIGYGSVFHEIFSGYVGEVQYRYRETLQEISITAFDAITLMSLHYRSLYYTEKKCSDVLKTILSDYSKILSIGKVDASGDQEFPVLSCHGRSDFAYIREILCPYAGKEFYIFNGKAYFQPVKDRNQTPCIALQLGRSLFDFSLTAGYGNIEISAAGFSRTDHETAVLEKATGRTDFSQKSAVSQAQKQYFPCMQLADTASAKLYAAYFAEDCIAACQTGEGTCTGLPEIVPGRCIEIYGIQKEYDKKKFWVSSVHHHLNQSGFRTRFQIKGWF